MDSIKSQKLRALKKHNKRTHQFLCNLMVYSVTAFLSTLFYLYLFWFPSMKPFFISIFLPNYIYSFIFSPKMLFIVGNVIVVFLVVGDKGGSQYSSPSAEIYDEYVRRSRCLNRETSTARPENYYHKKKNIKGTRKGVEMRNTTIRKCMSLDAMNVYLKDENKREMDVLTHKNGTEAVVFKVDPMKGKLGRGEGEGEQEEEEGGGGKPFPPPPHHHHHHVLTNDELNRRVEEFIARVNRQRRLEESQGLLIY